MYHFVYSNVSYEPLGLGMMVKCSPDPKEAYGKAKKEDTPTEEKPAQQPVQLDCVSFPDFIGNQYTFFNTHVKPGMYGAHKGRLWNKEYLFIA